MFLNFYKNTLNIVENILPDKISYLIISNRLFKNLFDLCILNWLEGTEIYSKCLPIQLFVEFINLTRIFS